MLPQPSDLIPTPHLPKESCISVFYIYIYLWRDREGDFKKLAHMFVGAGKSKIHKVGWLTGNSSKISCFSLKSEIHRAVGWKIRQVSELQSSYRIPSSETSAFAFNAVN